ncbi:hypothetical protein ACJX0J_017922, partial [Zea mays]
IYATAILIVGEKKLAHSINVLELKHVRQSAAAVAQHNLNCTHQSLCLSTFFGSVVLDIDEFAVLL